MPSLAHAIRKNSVSLAQVQNNYKLNVLAVNTVMTGITRVNFPPPLNQYPPDWPEFDNAYKAAESEAYEWTHDVMTRLEDAPGDVRTYNNVISYVLQDLKNQCKTLIAQPDNEPALMLVEDDLLTLTSKLALVTSFISDTITAIQKSNNKLPDLAAQLQSIADKSTKDADADQSKIDSLNAEIEKLKADIQSLTSDIVAFGIVDGASLTLGAVATIALWPIGAIAWFFVAPAVAAASTYIALDAKKIDADNAEIKSILTTIDYITHDVSALHLLAQNFSDLATQTVAIETNVKALLGEWKTLENDIHAAVIDIKEAISDAQNRDFSAVLNDVNEAITAWNETYAQAGSLVLDLKFNDANLQYGMSSAQVQTAMAGAKTMDLISYYNQASLRKRVA
ncbi:enterotoxin (HBL) [Pseudomonas chlororaphis]|uniref:Enterotoxin (HBL) n=1 Tax=Pseudomonas chlororaphis TaxID=587753 RepID=A0AAX3FTF0_9PSED|nr:enterotoxin (HBL) [Pseudomonas chlororaphis]AZC39419.1 hypothetical protein C4K37_5054 [Pseudomonas chlororaphis subsp. piscium]AZC45971.1 hypothetical protein C4K36_5068 [Pseudomonas chlororaphis subsp. piscium]WDG71504.1 hypothetical protein PUP65_25880 [Pseudomonas chlororaphis]WDH30712.1 hypothetical protein PUP81_08440 [Pseudomonas chlororaphis]WDH70029.1 hypothetical protein PUP78_25865 [Pseudomonas chlororaphis]